MDQNPRQSILRASITMLRVFAMNVDVTRVLCLWSMAISSGGNDLPRRIAELIKEGKARRKIGEAVIHWWAIAPGIFGWFLMNVYSGFANMN